MVGRGTRSSGDVGPERLQARPAARSTAEPSNCDRRLTPKDFKVEMVFMLSLHVALAALAVPLTMARAFFSPNA
jgi:hypothetical protein